MKQQNPERRTAALSGSAVDTNKFIAVETRLTEILLQYLQAADFFEKKSTHRQQNQIVSLFLLSLGSLSLSLSLPLSARPPCSYSSDAVEHGVMRCLFLNLNGV